MPRVFHNDMLTRISFLISLCCLTACNPLTRYVIRSTPVDLPGLTKSGESSLSVAGGINSNAGRDVQGGVDARVAYAIGNQWALTGGFSYRGEYISGPNEQEVFLSYNPYASDYANIRYRNSNGNGGLVYFPHIGGPFYLLGAAGGGGGRFNFMDQGVYHDTSYQSPFRTGFFDYYVQGGIYFMTRHVDVGCGIRWTLYQYTRVSDNYTPEQEEAFKVNDLEGTALGLAQLYGFVKVYKFHRIMSFDIQWSLDPVFASNRVDYNGYPVSLSFGIGVDIARLLRPAQTRN